MPEQFVRPKFPVTAAVEDFMWNRTSEHTAANKTTSSTLNVTANSILQNVTGNVSAVEGCYLLNFEEMEFLPWDNLDNIVSAEVENIARRLKDGVFLPILFVIGAPANVINMAVFYKQGLKERVNLCLFALSLADELYLIQAMFVFGIDQLQQQFASKAGFGPMTRFMINNNLIGFFGFTFTSQVLSAIIASDRCFCVLSPLRFQNLLRTRTMAIIVFVVYLVVMGLYFLISTRYRIVCVFDPVSDTVRYTVEASQFYRKNRLIFYVDSFVFGAGIPVVVIVVVTAATIITAMKIRQAALWRAGTSLASSRSSLSISPREVALTKMLIGSSVLFIVCVSPMALLRFCWLFLPEMNVGRRNHNFFLISQWIKETFSFSNSTFNIFVYYTMGSRYRATFCALFGREKQDKAKEGPSMTMSTAVRQRRQRISGRLLHPSHEQFDTACL